jgi:hypothetical protein
MQACLQALEEARRLAPPVAATALAGLVAGLFPDEVARERELLDDPG